MSNAGKYGQGRLKKIPATFKDYFDGKVDEDTAKKNFEKAITELYPNLEKVEWPSN